MKRMGSLCPWRLDKRFLIKENEVTAYYYKQTEPGLWTVGTREGKSWSPEGDYGSPQEATSRVNFLNGGGMTFTMKDVEENAKKRDPQNLVDAILLLVAQVQRVADALENMNGRDGLEESARIWGGG